MTDNVNNPSHYGHGSIECIDYIEDFLTREEYIGYLRGNIAKYNHRWRHKNGLEDLAKAQWYHNRLITFMRNADEYTVASAIRDMTEAERQRSIEREEVNSVHG